jgi:hypothetical protein
MQREIIIKQLGYNLISIWETEWKNEKKNINTTNAFF